MSGQEGFPDNVLPFVRKAPLYDLVEPPEQIGSAALSPEKTPGEDTVAHIVALLNGMGDHFTSARIAKECRELTAKGHPLEDVNEYALLSLFDINEEAYRVHKGIQDSGHIVEASRLAGR